MPRQITLEVYIGKLERKNYVGEVEVTQDQFLAAILEWNSEAMMTRREKWVDNKGETKVFWCKDRCYPPKHIMRIACREQVKELAARTVNAHFKQKLQEGLSKGSGVYQLIHCYDRTKDLGYKVEKSVDPEKKRRCGR